MKFSQIQAEYLKINEKKCYYNELYFDHQSSNPHLLLASGGQGLFL
jgi:hypothetical protein